MGAFALVVDWRDGNAHVDLSDAECALGGFSPAGWQSIEAVGFRASSAIDPASGVGTAPGDDWRRRSIVLLDGRLSLRCRQRLQKEILGAVDAAAVDDAALLAQAWVAAEASIAALLEGDFALAIYDTQNRRLWLMRSHSGARGLYYVHAKERVAVATRASAALAAAGIALHERQDSVAAFFALRAPPPGCAYFKDVSALVPGTCFTCDAQGPSSLRIGVQDKHGLPQFIDDASARDAWLGVLSEAVAESLSDCRQPGVMLSGGLDSSALAAIGQRKRGDLLACSWVLRQTPASNEQAWIEATTTHLRLAANVFEGDQDWPLARRSQWLVEDDGPPANPYRGLHQHLYRVAAAAGCDALMTGNFGDHLYPEAAAGFGSGRLERGCVWTLAQHWQLLRQQGWKALWHEPGWRASIRPQRAGKWSAPQWLLPQWSVALRDGLGDAMPISGADCDEAIQDAELGRRFHCMYGIEMLAPYRDRRVIDFAAALPAYFQYRPGQAKYLTREAMRGLLPESVRQRPKGGSLVPFFMLGVLQEEAQSVAKLLDAADARWPRYVLGDALQSARDRARERVFTESDLLLIWLCASYELWWRAHWEGGPAVLASRVKSSDISEAFRD